MQPPVPPPPDAGAPLDGSKYRLLTPLGQGGMGQVWLAEHVALSTEVVVKFLDPSLVDRKDLGDRMRLEAQALAQLRHPNVVAVLDAGRTSTGYPFFVMERLRGKTLDVEIRARSVLPVLEALDLVCQTLAGLGAAHGAGIVHRDVKPSNLFLCDPTATAPHPRLKLIDFGIVKVVTGGSELRPLDIPTEEGALLGTLTALSPEQALSRPVDHRADIYAAGLILFRLLTGEHPFGKLRGGELVRSYSTLTPEPPSRTAPQPVHPELDAAVLKALERRPEDRFQSAAEMTREIERIVLSLKGGGFATRESQRTSFLGSMVTPDVPPTSRDAVANREREQSTTVVAPTPGTPLPEQSTERLASGEIAALTASMLGPPPPPPLRTEDVALTRTAETPLAVAARDGAAERRRFLLVAAVTAALVVALLGLALWR